MKNPPRVEAGKRATSKVWPRVCPQCKKPFDGTAKQKFCSRKCKENAKAAPRVPKACGWCGQVTPAAIGRQKYCSDACRKHGRFPRPTPRKCSVCPKEFIPERGKTIRLTCSDTCRTIHQSRRRFLARRPDVDAAELAAELEKKSRERNQTDSHHAG